MQRAALVLIGLLLVLGSWTLGASYGYERGKSDATSAVAPTHLVFIRDGCIINTTPYWDIWFKQNRVVPVWLVRQ